jgi:hypothetical protein
MEGQAVTVREEQAGAVRESRSVGAYVPESRSLAVYAPGRSPIIKGLVPGLTERGKIKIGKKGEQRKSQSGGVYQLPVKLDHFLVTTLERGPDGNFVLDSEIHKIVGAAPRKLPISLLFDSIDLSFGCRYAAYDGKNLWCSGDGEYANRIGADGKRSQLECPCERSEPTYKGEDGKGKRKCKINGSLSCMIRGANSVGGVWKFRTTGYNSTVGILSSLSLIRTFTGGYLAGLPLTLTVQPKIATSPTDGASLTIYVVGVEFDGTVEQLQTVTLQQSTGNALFRQRLAHVEEEARRMIGVDAELVDQAGDIAEEYYPEDAELPEPEAQRAPQPAVQAAAPQPTAQQTAQPVPPAESGATRRRGRPPRAQAAAEQTAEKKDAAPAEALQETSQAQTPAQEPEVQPQPAEQPRTTEQPQTTEQLSLADLDMGF